MELYYQSAHQLQRLLQQRQISVTEIVQAQLDRIRQIDDQVHCYINVWEEQALERAKFLDQRLQAGTTQSTALYGVPIAYKDNICTAGRPTTCASKMLTNYTPTYNATVVERLEQAGMVMTGKVNLDEFAMGSSTENSAFFTTRNPWDRCRVPGGSSGGSAAVVAAGGAVVSLGSDTGGSVRQPAALCGVVGMKPTYGRVSRYGLIAYASSLDQVGPVTRDVTDCALVMNQMAGHDPKDSTTGHVEVEDYTQALVTDVHGLKIGVPTEYYRQGIQPEIVEQVQRVIQRLTRLGAEAEEFSMPYMDSALPVYYMVASAEASSNLARFDGVRYGYRAENAQSLEDLYRLSRSQGLGKEVKQRILQGTYAICSGCYEDYYLKAKKVWTLVREDFDQAFEKYDILITPTTPTTAFKVGQNTQESWAMYMSDMCTVPMNLAGVPAISIPIGFDSQGLPIGMQIVAKHFDEMTLFRVAYTVEQELGVFNQHPIIGQRESRAGSESDQRRSGAIGGVRR